MASKNITFKSTDPWHSSVGSLYENDVINWVLQNPDKWQTINNFQRNHYNIYSRNTDNGQIRSLIDTDLATKNYQSDINRTFGFVNTKGISGAIASGRYNPNERPESGDRTEQSWKPEGLYGAYTDDRRLLGRKGDYDTGQLEMLAERLEPAGLEIYLDSDTNYYMIRPIDEKLRGETVDETTGKPVERPRVQTSIPQTNTPTDWLSLRPRQKTNSPGWSDWLPLTAKKIVDDLVAIRTGNLERQKVFPKVQAPHEQAKVTDAYAQRQLFEKQKAEVLHRSGYNPTSNLATNLQARTEGEKLASEITDKQVALKSQEFAETSRLVQEVANRNKLAQVNAANQNNQINAAAMNSIIDSRIKQNERLATNLGTYIGDMYTNYGEYLKTKRLNENASKRQEAQYQFNRARTAAYKPYYNLQDNPSTWSRLNEFKNAINAEGLTSLTEDQKRIWNEAAISGNYNNPEFINLLITQLKSGTSPVAQKYRTLYNQDLQDLSRKAEYLSSQAESDLYSALSSIDTYATNQWGWNPRSQVRKFVLSQKQGGKVEDRFSKLERIRQREQQSVRENTQKRNKTLSDNLNKQLDRISKEELALLRAIFK